MKSFHQTHNSIGDMIFNTVTYENSSFFSHFHKSYELIYVAEGNLECSINGKNYTFGKGSFALIFPYQIHSWHIGDGKAYICVFSESYVKSFAKAAEGLVGANPNFRCRPFIEDYFREIMLEGFPNHYINLPPPDNSLPIKSALYGVLNEFLSSVPLVQSSAQANEHLSIAILEYISYHFTENITLQDIASALGYSYQHISRVFNQKINTPFKDLLNWYRFEFAKQMLYETSMPITDIAHESGFQSIRNYNLVCSKLCSMTPSELRRSAKLRFD